MLLQNTALKGGSGILVEFSGSVKCIKAAISISDSVVVGLVSS
jgi:hypothetical protein